MHTSSHCIANLNASMRNIFCLPIAIWSTNDGIGIPMCIHTTLYHPRLKFSIPAKRNSQNFIMMSSLLLDFHMVLIYLYSARDIPLCCMQYSNLHIWLLLKTIGRLWKNLAIILQAKSSKQQWFHSRFLEKFSKKKPESWTVFFVIF